MPTDAKDSRYKSRDEQKQFSGTYQRLFAPTISTTSVLQRYVLAILAQKGEPMSGSEILDHIKQRTTIPTESGEGLSPGWEPGHGGVYQGLMDMENAGLVEMIEAPLDPKRKRPPANQKRPYRITDAGRAALAEYLVQERERAIAAIATSMRVFSDLYDPTIIEEATRRIRLPAKKDED